MIAYIIKSVLCLLILWGFYKIALEQQAVHQLKRFYLLGCLVIALVLPLITLSYSVEVEPQPAVEQIAFDTIAVTDEVNTSIEETIHWTPILIGSIYAAGVLLFGFRFLGNLYRLREKVTHNERVKSKSHINVLLLEKIVPHSFLNYIFLPKNDFKNNAIALEVLAHEQAHVSQKHSWDILFIEILQVVFWFNPLFILIKNSIRLNHEFLADKTALKEEADIKNYTNLLFTYSGGSHQTALSSPINYSLTKKRIIMLSKTRSVKKLTARLALFVPVFTLCVYFFNQEIVAKPVSDEGIQPNETSVVAEQKNEPTASPIQTWKNQELMTLTIRVEDELVWVNGVSTSIENFVKTINEVTKDWTNSDMMNYSTRLQAKNGVDNVISALSKEFKKTKLYKTNPTRELIPPPPPPAPAVPQGQLPPPPPPPTPADPAAFANDKYNLLNIKLSNTEAIEIEGQKTTISKAKDFIKSNFKDWTQDTNEKPRGVLFHLPEGVSESQAHKVFKKIQDFKINRITFKKETPAPPAPPKIGELPQASGPTAMINTLKENNGTAYYNGKKVSYETALSVMKQKKNLQILLNENKGKGTPDLIIKDN
ncbi:beta-lactamase regulating signal transducer with metallopeptidase domain [Leeuwenhoekiella aequorea]|uniref:Beta-lactamase regulating signal transducer with metallopeptidase domain n=1 Tax=Leeuwenhoekiella aequorea TaxID=283736 RepID=A0A4Q0P620_9FLAO|nr:beta-lactamase regulating signal transducer with metallopeptidase domain [Leeuwenhoekiella aequorea]